MTRRREFAVVAMCCCLGAVLILIAAGQTWVRVRLDMPNPLPDKRYTETGADLAPLAGALGVAGLAGVAGMVATRGYARIVTGVLLVLFGAAACYASVRGIGDDAIRQALSGRAVLLRDGGFAPDTSAWWVISALGGVLLALSGAVTAVRGRLWPGLSRKYEAPETASAPERRVAARGRKSETPDDLWDSLDRGHDPTSS